MLTRLCICILFLSCSLAWCQSDNGGTDASVTDSSDDTQLRVPPPVSGDAYSADFAGEERSNFLRVGFTATSAYATNLTGAGSSNSVAGMSYSIWPTFALDSKTSQAHLVLSYSPGFTYYQHADSDNQMDQNLSATFQYRASPYLTLSLQEGFQKTANIFNQPNPLSATSVSGAFPTQAQAIVAPNADQISNATGAQLTYQLGPSSMVGVTGNFGISTYPGLGQGSGLYNSRSDGASVYYSRSFGEKYSVGGTYQYQNTFSYQGAAVSTQTQTQTVFIFLTAYLRPKLSLSVSVGPQHYNATQTSFPASASWSPMTMVSLGWQGGRTSLAASYARIVTGGGGLNGAFHSNSVSASAGWQLSRLWTAGVSGGYASNTTLTPLFIQSSAGGHSLTGTVSAQRPLGDHLNVQFGYNWIHQNYSGITAISENPNSNRVFVSFSYQFTKPLQR